MLPILNIGPLAIQLPGLILLVSIWLGLSIAEKGALRRGIHPDQLYMLVMIGAGAGLLGARLSSVLQNPQAFLSDPWSILSLNPGLLDPIGGAAAGFLGALAYGQRKGMPLWSTLDALTPLWAAIAFAMPMANLSSGAGFGRPTNLPWAIDLWGAKRHPTQVYEAFAAGGILVHLMTSKVLRSLPSGVVFWYFILLTAGSRLFLEIFRGDSITLAWGLRLPQMLAWLVLLLALWQLRKRAGSQPENT